MQISAVFLMDSHWLVEYITMNQVPMVAKEEISLMILLAILMTLSHPSSWLIEVIAPL